VSISTADTRESMTTIKEWNGGEIKPKPQGIQTLNKLLSMKEIDDIKKYYKIGKLLGEGSSS